MILTCEKCATRFRLDESRLPAKGARVRCSRCKHSFFVRAPGVSAAEAIDAVAAEAARTAQPSKPEIAWDLEDGADPGSTLQRARPAAVAEPSGDLDDESEWRFEDEMPELGDSGASLDLPNGEAPALAAAPDPNESSFAALGDPESWDLLSSSDSGSAPAAAATPIGGLQVPPVRERRETTAAVEEAPSHARVPEAVRSEPRVEAPAARAVEPPLAIRRAGWAATAAFALLVLAGGLRTPSPSAAAPAAAPIGALAVENVRARLVDNAFGGPVFVVSGEVHNPSGEARPIGSAIGVVLLDAAGAPLDRALAQPALDVASLRSVDPAQLHEAAEQGAASLASRTLAPDARLRFDAVFRGAPRGAVRFAIEAHDPRATAPAS